MVGIAWAFSSDRRAMPWRTVAWGIGLQFALALVLLKTFVGRAFFNGMSVVAEALTHYVDAGSQFVFGGLIPEQFSFAIEVLPIIVFMGSFFAILYHLGVMQHVVNALAAVLSRTLRTSGAEALAAVGNVFVGMAESALVVRPYLERMTRSELFSLMTVGMSTVAGSVMFAYVRMLGSGDYAGHLATASLLSAPAGILIAKVMIPERDVPETLRGGRAGTERTSINVIDAAAQGATAGLRLAAYVGALLIAFVALIALANDLIGTIGGWFGADSLTLQQILGTLLAPLAWLMGVPWADAPAVGALLGIKTVLNEFVAYIELANTLSGATGGAGLQPRSVIIATYALSGFANFGSIAIQIGGIGGIAPSRRHDLSRLGLRAMIGGTIAAFMTATVAGMIL